MMKRNYYFRFIFLILFLVSLTSFAHKTIYIGTGIPGWWGGSLFNTNTNADGHREPMYLLKQKLTELGYEVKEARSFDNLHDADFIILYDTPPVYMLPVLSQYPKEKLILFLWEPPTVRPDSYQVSSHGCFSEIYTWSDDLVNDERYFKFYYPVLQPMIDKVIDFKDKKLCTLIACNKSSRHKDELYSARKKAIDFFEQLNTDEFDLFGRGWNAKQYKTYKGKVNRKLDYLKKYRFCICYENIKNISGYVTEKIFDCFRAGCVPVYWGASNIAEYIPKNCFIARDEFADEQELYDFMKNMPQEEYNQYIDNIKNYLQSDLAQLYSTEHFIDTFLQAIGHDE